jgi:23S rRNA pseudouridine2605 synthase
LRTGGRNSWIEVVLDEGKNRHIRRMLDRVGVETLRLVRVAIGPLALGKIAKGSYRELSSAEKKATDAVVRKKVAGPVNV